MCDSKYHEEACRKARVIERRAEAQQRMMGKPDQVQTTSGPMPGGEMPPPPAPSIQPVGYRKVIHHRHKNNAPPDSIKGLIAPPIINYNEPIKNLTKRVPHYKV